MFVPYYILMKYHVITYYLQYHYNESTHKKEEAQYHFTITFFLFLTELYYYLNITINQHK